MVHGSETGLPLPVVKLLDKGVHMPVPFSVEIGDEVDPGRIAKGVVLYGGTRIRGAKTLISAGVKLGQESPVTLEDCRLGPGVELKGGFFRSSVFLERAGMASGAHVREGCLLEEEASGGHSVGLKMTILFPFVTLGSLINFCDCLMAGGTSRRDHSEVGSSYIHFNYTPNQDKATFSILGDVSRGVMLRESPIFLGGQGGLVGPARIGYGTVIAAGTVWRTDCPEGGGLLKGGGQPVTTGPFHPGLYGDIRRRVTNNLFYLANLLALRQWYLHVRGGLTGEGPMGEGLFRGALETLELAVAGGMARLGTLAGKMAVSRELARKLLPAGTREFIVHQQREFQERWPELEAALTEGGEASAGLRARDAFLLKLADAEKAVGRPYLRVIQSLDADTRALGTTWLDGVVGDVLERALNLVPACRR